MTTTKRAFGPKDLNLDFPMHVLLPYKRISSELTSKSVKIHKPEFEEADIDVELGVTLPPDVYGVYPRIFLLWAARQIADRHYLPSAIAREIPLIPFDLFTASLDIVNGVSAQARQKGLREFLEAFPDFSLGFDVKPRKGRGFVANNTILINRLHLGFVALTHDSSFHLDDREDQKEEILQEIGPEDTVLESPAFVQISEQLQQHIAEFQRVPAMQVVRAIAHSPLALDLYADMLFRGLDATEWLDSSPGIKSLWLDWPGKDIFKPAQVLCALDLIKAAEPANNLSRD